MRFGRTMRNATARDQLSIDWARVASPQADGYDTAVVLSLVAEEMTPWRHEPVQRPASEPPALRVGGHSISVGIGPLGPLIEHPRFEPVSGIPAALERGIDYVKRWPEAAMQWPQIVHRIQCYTDNTIAEKERSDWLKSASHSVDERFGEIALTVDSDINVAQCIVHEMAHHKLRAMGVGNERCVRFVANPPTELYKSPVVQEVLRPMTAVLHAQYSFIHVAQLDIHMLSAETRPGPYARIRSLLALNVQRMEQGLEVIEKHMRVDEEGEAFMSAFLDWIRSVIRTGRAMLAEKSSSAEPSSGLSGLL
jgi:hypothetical protein